MVPNNYGVIRQLTKDLIALPFLQLENCKIEEVNINFLDNIAISGTGQTSTINGFVGAYNIDVSKYDYIILPYSGQYSFNCTSGITKQPNPAYVMGYAPFISFAIFKVLASTAVAHVTLLKDIRDSYNINSFLGIIIED